VASRYPGAATCARGCGVTTSLRQGARDAHYPFGVHRGCGRGEARCTRWVAMHPLGRSAPDRKGCIAYRSGAAHTDRVQCRRQQVEPRARALKGAQGRASGGAFIRRGRARARLGRDDLVEGHLAVEGGAVLARGRGRPPRGRARALTWGARPPRLAHESREPQPTTPGRICAATGVPRVLVPGAMTSARRQIRARGSPLGPRDRAGQLDRGSTCPRSAKPLSWRWTGTAPTARYRPTARTPPGGLHSPRRRASTGSTSTCGVTEVAIGPPRSSWTRPPTPPPLRRNHHPHTLKSEETANRWGRGRLAAPPPARSFR